MSEALSILSVFRQDPWVFFSGVFAIVFGAGAWISVSRSRVLGVAGLGSLFWCLHFFLLGALTASLANLFIALRTLAASRAKGAFAKHAIFWGFLPVFALIGWVSWVSPISLLPVAAAIWSTFCYAYLPNRAMRLGILLSSLLWMGQSVFWGSWQNVLAELLRFSATLWGLYRLHDSKESGKP